MGVSFQPNTSTIEGRSTQSSAHKCCWGRKRARRDCADKSCNADVCQNPRQNARTEARYVVLCPSWRSKVARRERCPVRTVKTKPGDWRGAMSWNQDSSPKRRRKVAAAPGVKTACFACRAKRAAETKRHVKNRVKIHARVKWAGTCNVISGCRNYLFIIWVYALYPWKVVSSGNWQKMRRMQW